MLVICKAKYLARSYSQWWRMCQTGLEWVQGNRTCERDHDNSLGTQWKVGFWKSWEIAWICTRVCVCSFQGLYYSFLERVGRQLSSEWKIDWTAITYWMGFLSSNFIGEIKPNQEPSVQIIKTFHQYRIAEKTKIICCECFNVASWIAYLYWK